MSFPFDKDDESQVFRQFISRLKEENLADLSFMYEALPPEMQSSLRQLMETVKFQIERKQVTRRIVTVKKKNEHS